MPCQLPAPISLLSAWRRSKRVALRGPSSGVNSVVPPRCRRRYRFVGPPSSSLPTNRFSAVLPQSKRRSAPREVTSRLSPERLVRRLAVSTMYKFLAAMLQSCQAYCERRGDVGLKPDSYPGTATFATNSTSPVGAPLGEPPGGSRLIASCFERDSARRCASFNCSVHLPLFGIRPRDTGAAPPPGKAHS